jgi:hypothetical protein
MLNGHTAEVRLNLQLYSLSSHTAFEGVCLRMESGKIRTARDGVCASSKVSVKPFQRTYATISF